MPITETCITRVHRGGDWHGRYEPCGRPAKGTLADGSPACGVHLRVAARRDATIVARERFEARQRAVSEALGIYVGGFEPGNRVTVLLSELERLVAERTEGA